MFDHLTFYRLTVRLQQPLTVTCTSLGLFFAAVGHTLLTRLSSRIMKITSAIGMPNMIMRTVMAPAGSTHYFANGHYNYSGTLKIHVDAQNAPLFNISGAGEWQGDAHRLTIRLTSLTVKMVSPVFLTSSVIAELEHNVTT